MNKDVDRHSQETKGEQRKPLNPLRAPNAFAAALVFAFFLFHAMLGTFAVLTGWRGELAWVIWVAVVVIGIHILLSVATTYVMFTDTVRVASPRKRRHQWLKWLTGATVFAGAAWHASGAQQLLEAPAILGALAAIVAVAALAWHSWVGVKSLTRDLRLPSGLRAPLRVVAVVVAIVLSAVLLITTL